MRCFSAIAELLLSRWIVNFQRHLRRLARNVNISTFSGKKFRLCEMTWCPPFWNCDDKLKTWLRQSMRIYVKNIPAKFHPDQIWNNRGLFWRGRPNKNKKNNNNVSSDMRSVPDLINTFQKLRRYFYVYWWQDVCIVQELRVPLHHGDWQTYQCHALTRATKRSVLSSRCVCSRDSGTASSVAGQSTSSSSSTSVSWHWSSSAAAATPVRLFFLLFFSSTIALFRTSLHRRPKARARGHFLLEEGHFPPIRGKND